LTGVKQVKVKNYREIRAEPVLAEPGVAVRWLVSEVEEQPEFAMRLYEIEPGGATTAHTHYWEHEVFVLAGNGAVIGEEGEILLGEGDIVYVPPLERHQFVSKEDEVFRFLMTFPIPRGAGGLEAE
jgi:quercetin dioxygenase-like cupin family protein